MKAENLIAFVFVALYLAFAVVWVMQFQRRIEPALRARIGQMLGFRIIDAFKGRGKSWQAAGDAPRNMGCLLLFWELVVKFGVGVLPLFAALLVMGLVMFALFDQ
jgi:hypothetical protein